MKILIRVFGLIIVSVLITIGLIRLVNINIIINEMNNVSSIAVEQTQKIVKDNIINKYENIEQHTILNDEDYRNYFIERFRELVKDPSIYDLSNVDASYKYGLLYVDIKCNKYKLVNNKKLLNIIEIDGEYGMGDRYKRGYSVWSEIETNKRNEITGYEESIEWSEWQKEKPEKYFKRKEIEEELSIPRNQNFNVLLHNNEYPIELYSWEFDDDTYLLKWDLDIFSYIKTASRITDAYWFPGLRLKIYDENGDEQIIDEREQSDYYSSSKLIGDDEIQISKAILEATEYDPYTGYEIKVNIVSPGDSYLKIKSPYYSYVTKWSIPQLTPFEENEELHRTVYSYEVIYYRYIDRENSYYLSNDSIWNSAEYNEVLNNYLNLYEETI